MRIWVTRTEPGASQTADALRRAGHEPVVQPVLVYQALPGASVDLSGAAAIAFTSRNAVEIFAALSGRRDLPVFVPGEGTAAAARDAGFTEVSSAAGGAAELTELIALAAPSGPVVWPAVTEPAGDLVELLAANGVACLCQPIYETVAAAGPAPADIEAVIVHSPKGASVIAERLSPSAARAITAYAISAAAAAPLRELPFKRVAVAPRPSETALLDLIAG